MRKVAKALLACAMCLPLLHGCTASRKTVAYTVYPVGWLLNTISGNTIPTVSIQNETPVVVEGTSLKSNYRDLLKSAKAFFHIGGLEPYITVMGKTVEESGVDEQDLSSLNAIYDFARYREVISKGEITFIESAYYDGTVFKSIDTNTKDLYFWNDPISMMSMGRNICDWLKENYPDKADDFDENYQRLETELIDLDAKYQAYAETLVQDKETISFVSVTPSFGTWQKTYGFQIYPLVLSRFGEIPTEAQITLIETRIRTDGVKYIFHETNLTPDMEILYARVQKDLDLTPVEVSNLSALSASQQTDGKDYLSIMYENLAQLESIQPSAIPSAK